jgi:hypothetical protein
MSNLPPEIPPIVRWREHLPKMKNSNYCVEGVTSRFIKFQIWEDNQTVRMFLAARYYDYGFAEIPEALRHWIPVDVEGARAYDHTLAELGIQPPVVLEQQEPDEEEPEEDDQILTIKKLLIKTITDQNNESSELKDKLNQVILSLKDQKSGIYGANVIPQTKGIVNAVNSIIKMNSQNLEAFTLAIKVFTEFQNKKRK